jgi:hypothetical protein
MLIQNSYELDIFIDDLNIFEAQGVVFIHADIFEAIVTPVPTCTLEMSIPIGWMDGRSLVDGTKIRFKLKNTDYLMDNNYDFRLFNIKKLELNQQFVYVKIDGVLDFYDGYRHANDYNMYGPSSDIFKKVAADFNLENTIDDTNDIQLWVAGQNNLYQYLTRLTQEAYIDETSGMFWCFDRHKILLYKNLTTLFRERQDKIFSFAQVPYGNIKDKVYSYSKSSISIQSGLENLKNEGYGGSDSVFDFLEYKTKDIAATKVVAESNLINISKELSQGLSQEFMPFDVGNDYPEYHVAKKQNKRVLSTYSTYCTLVCQFFMPYRIAQIVNLEYLDAQDQNNKIESFSGCYMINAIHMDISLESISSVLELVMQGFNGNSPIQEVY